MRTRYLALAIATIAAGLTVHFAGSVLSPVSRDVLGDALWAMMIVWSLSVLAPHWRLSTRSMAALAVCAGVELSQRLHTPFLDAVRRTVPGHLVFGSDYDPRDFLAYAAGVALAVVLARINEK